MKVISNTSPLIALSKIERIFLLEKLFEKVVIPRAVYDEFLQNGTPDEQEQFISGCRTFIEVVGVLF
jgi:predicted nucleic acid-binding protein